MYAKGFQHLQLRAKSVFKIDCYEWVREDLIGGGWVVGILVGMVADVYAAK
jgi:hypothetical protein